MRASFSTIKSHVLGILKNKLPDFLTYHSINHTLYVLDRVEYIATREKVSKEDLFLLKVATLYHDIGFIKTRVEHEQIGCGIVRKELPDLGFNEKEIDLICGMIMATRIPQQPKTLLEEILADADLEYLGTRHFEKVGELLYQELKHYNPNLTRQEWNDIQISFMQSHNYHTRFCKRYKSFRKQNNLDKLKT